MLRLMKTMSPCVASAFDPQINPPRLQKPCKVRARRWPVTVQYGENLHDGQRPVLSSVLTEFERTDQLEGA